MLHSIVTAFNATNSILKIGQMINFMVCMFYHNKRKKERKSRLAQNLMHALKKSFWSQTNRSKWKFRIICRFKWYILSITFKLAMINYFGLSMIFYIRQFILIKYLIKYSNIKLSPYVVVWCQRNSRKPPPETCNYLLATSGSSSDGLKKKETFSKSKSATSVSSSMACSSVWKERKTIHNIIGFHRT